MRLFDESVEEHFLLLTFSWSLPWIQMEGVDWSEWGVFEFKNLARKLYTANELIFAEYCEFQACQKRGMKSGYQRWYRLIEDGAVSSVEKPIGPEFWPGNVALSWLMLVIVQDIWTFVKVVLASWSWMVLEAQDLWSHLTVFDVNLSLVDHQGRYTLPRELLLIFLKWTDSWLRQIGDPSTRIIHLLLFLGVNTRWS